METKRIPGAYAPWSDSSLVPQDLVLTGENFELKETKVKKSIVDGETVNKLSAKYRVGTFNFWVDATLVGNKDADGIDLPQKGVCDVKDGLLTNMREVA